MGLTDIIVVVVIIIIIIIVVIIIVIVVISTLKILTELLLSMLGPWVLQILLLSLLT